MAHDNINQAPDATREHEMALQRITAQYIDAYEHGEHPSIEEYIRRYPAFASELLEFALFYQSYVAGVLEPTAPPEPKLDANASAALSRIRASRRAASPAAAAVPYAGTPRGAIQPIQGIAREGIKRGLPPAKLAAILRITPDVLAKLDARAITVASIPHAFLRHVADELKVPTGAITAYLSGQVSAQPSFFFAEKAPEQGQESFVRAIEESALPPDEKVRWREAAEREGLPE